MNSSIHDENFEKVSLNPFSKKDVLLEEDTDLDEN